MGGFSRTEGPSGRVQEGCLLPFCGARKAERHLGISLSVVSLSVRLSHFWFAYNFFTLRDRAFIFGMCVPCDKTKIQRNLTGNKISTSSTKFVFLGPIGKTRWPPWPLIGWDIYDFSSETAERNSTKLDRKQEPNILYQVCVFRADRKNKMAALASDWLRHLRLLLWNRWTEFNETWQQARTQHPLPSLCFSIRSVNKNVSLGRFLKKVAHCTQVHDMWPFGPLVMPQIEWSGYIVFVLSVCPSVCLSVCCQPSL